MRRYMRDDGAEMVEIKPGQFVSRAAAEKLGLALLVRAPTPPRRVGGSAREGARKGPAPKNKAKRAAPLNKRAKVPA